MNKLWVKAHKRHRIVKNQDAPCGWGEYRDVLREILRDMDYPCPLWLEKHEKEFESFRRTVFKPEHFMEEVPFDELEVIFLDDADASGHHPKDPRNEF